MSDLLQLEDASGILLHESSDRMLLEDGVPYVPSIAGEGFLVRLSMADVGLLAGHVLNAEAFTLAIGFVPSGLHAGRLVPAEAFSLTLNWAQSGLVSGRALGAEPFQVSLLWSDEVTAIIGRVVGAEPFTITLGWTDVGLTRGYIFVLDSFVVSLTWADTELLRNAVVEGEAFALLTVFEEALLQRRRSEVGWDTSLQPSVCGGHQTLSDLTHPPNDGMGLAEEPLQPELVGAATRLSVALHPSGAEELGGYLATEPLQPVVGERKALSGATHPGSKPAVPLPLEVCK